MSQRPTERKRSQTSGRRRFVLLISSNPLGRHPEAMFIFRLFFLITNGRNTHLMFVTTGSPAVSLTVSQCKCMQARLPSAAMSHFHAYTHTHTLTYTHTPLSIHANAHFLHFFFKGNKKTLDYSGTMGESRSPRQQAERDWSRVCVCGMGGELVSEVLVLGKVEEGRGGLLQEQLLHLIS